ncbi:hypothetical protein [Actinocorallia sp. A-T 12471]|uniref:hypothetical protein n=1 Tax=Actinocorallia sp. A-T 12471 TaxID=3089813 RepID=UPI0029D25AB7|nr:hypothetical protein [Actinocorallia sp. A-T 12471]MDX6741963.1 hypothetical protein [Actinocorallia sp. A-T 12471]
MGRHRNDPRGLVNILIIAVGVALALGLVVVGGAALVSSMKSEALGPSDPPTSEASNMTATTDAKRKVYATIEFVRKVEVFAAGPGNTPVYWRGQFVKGDMREVLWPDVDVTIGDSSAVRVDIDGETLKLPAGKVTISFVEGDAEARSVED